MTDLISNQKLRPIPLEPPKKKFKAKHNQPKLQDYSKPAPMDFWANWPYRTWDQAKHLKGSIDVTKLKELAVDTGYPDPYMLNTVCDYLENGAKLGVAEECRVPSVSKNALILLMNMGNKSQMHCLAGSRRDLLWVP